MRVCRTLESEAAFAFSFDGEANSAVAVYALKQTRPADEDSARTLVLPQKTEPSPEVVVSSLQERFLNVRADPPGTNAGPGESRRFSALLN